MAWHDIFSSMRDLADNIARHELHELVECGSDFVKTAEEQDDFILESREAILGNLSRNQMIDLLDRYRRG